MMMMSSSRSYLPAKPISSPGWPMRAQTRLRIVNNRPTCHASPNKGPEVLSLTCFNPEASIAYRRLRSCHDDTAFVLALASHISLTAAIRPLRNKPESHGC
jgi:hypothetical protein